MSYHKKGVSSQKRKDWWKLVPIILVMAVIPLIVMMYRFDPNLNQFSWASPGESSTDFFNYYKSVALTMVGAVMGVMLICKFAMEHKKLEFTKVFYPLGVYAFFVIVSTVCSKYSYFSYNGMDDHFETVFILVTYCIITVYTFYYVRTEQDIKRVMGAWFISIVLLILIGISQVTGNDFFSTSVGSRMILPIENWNIADSLEFRFGPKVAYLTFFNPNYVGYFATLCIPVLLILCFFTKKLWLRIVYGISIIGVIICLLGAGAENGIIALGGSVLILVIGFRKKILKYWPIALGAAIILVGVFFSYDLTHEKSVTGALKRGLNFQKNNEYDLEKIITGKNAVEITYKKNTLSISSELDGNGQMIFKLKDQNDKSIEYENGYEARTTQSTGEDGKIVDTEYQVPLISIKDTRFLDFKIYPDRINEVDVFNINIAGRQWVFSNQTGKKGYYYYAPHGQFTKIVEAEKAGFLEGYEQIISGRGYIWSRSIPLLKNNILIGTGPDTFAITFPQRDYAAASNGGFYGMVITKPHNMYLQVGVQTGCISLVAMLVFYIMYVISCIKVYWKNPMETFCAQLGVAILASTFGYMISALVNDSSITIAPVYWCLMGLGLAINSIVKKEIEKKST